jgi:hypothetical protein
VIQPAERQSHNAPDAITTTPIHLAMVWTHSPRNANLLATS